MKRLFAIRKGPKLIRNEKTNTPFYFSSKMEAKKFRDSIQKEHSTPLHITPGPDHWKTRV